jgi:hypothetical protein
LSAALAKTLHGILAQPYLIDRSAPRLSQAPACFLNPSSCSNQFPIPRTRRNLLPLTRWVLPPKGSVQLVAQFASDSAGRFSELLGFEAVGGDRHSTVVLSGACDYPRINTDPK